MNISEIKVGQKLKLNSSASGSARHNLDGAIVVTAVGETFVYVNGDTIRSGNGYRPENFNLCVEPASVVPVLDFTKPIETVDGRPVEIITQAARDHHYPIKAYIGNAQTLESFTEDGYYHEDLRDHPANLRNAPERLTGYVNMYPKRPSSDSFTIHATRAIADREAGANRIGVTKVELVAGKFDE